MVKLYDWTFEYPDLRLICQTYSYAEVTELYGYEIRSWGFFNGILYRHPFGTCEITDVETIRDMAQEHLNMIALQFRGEASEPAMAPVHPVVRRRNADPITLSKCECCWHYYLSYDLFDTHCPRCRLVLSD